MIDTTVALIVVIACCVCVVYPHILYPLFLTVLRKLLPRPQSSPGSNVVNVDLCIAAHNEEALLPYVLASVDAAVPSGVQLRILLGSDGSTDSTVKIAREFPVRNCAIEVHDYSRRGKNAVINGLITQSTAEVVVFTDADCRLEPDALQYLLRHFSDNNIGAVLGCNDRRLVSSDDNAATSGEAIYRSLEDVVNEHESSLASCVASNGALYAVRRSALNLIPNDRAADDFCNVLSAISTRKRVVFERHARVAEHRPTEMSGEFRRTIRTVASGLSAVAAYKQLLGPHFGLTALFLWSHRILRWMSPVFLLIAAVIPWFVIHDVTLFVVLFYSQFLFYSLAFLGYALERYGSQLPVVSTIHFFVAMNIAMFMAWIRFLSKARADVWQPGESA